MVTKLKAETDGRLEVGRDAGRTDRAGRTGGRYRIVYAHRRGRRHPVLPDPAVMDLAATVGEPHLPGGTVLLRYEAKHD